MVQCLHYFFVEAPKQEMRDFLGQNAAAKAAAHAAEVEMSKAKLAEKH